MSATPAAGEPVVRVLDDRRREPGSIAEQCALTMLAREGSQRLCDLIERVASNLYRDELRRAGWTTDIGWLGAAAFRADATRAVEDGAGALWTIESETR